MTQVALTPRQQQAFNTHGTEILYGGAAGGGKLVANQGVVLTPFGFRKGIDLKVGDAVSNPDGSVAKIIAISDPMRLEKWTVHFHDGTSTEVAAGHLWNAWRSGKRKKRQNKPLFGEEAAEVIETRTLKEWCDEAKSQVDRGIRPNWPCIPVCQEQSFNRTSRWPQPDIDPYLFGMLLGDGHIGENQISITTADIEHIRAVVGSDVRESERRPGTYHVYFRGARLKQLQASFAALGLRNCRSWNKFIPDSMKWGPIEDRYAILQGLMDSDGYASDRAVYYTTTSERLAEDVKFLIQSLGGTATITSKIATCNGEPKRRAYTLYIKHREPEKLFRLERKRALAAEHPATPMYRRVVDVTVGGEIEGRCITVSHPNGLYMTNDFIVTHNSYLLRVSSIRWAMSVPGCQIYLFRRSFTDLRDNHLRGPTSYHELLGDFIKSKHVKWSAQDFEFTFWNGSRIKLAHAQFEDDILKYQGAEIHVLMIDELTHFTETMYRFLRGRVRAVGLTVPESYVGRIPRIECGSNPGSVGHAWVKRTWINFAPPFKAKRAEPEEGGMIRQYIPAQLEDNPYLMEEDPLYESRLEGLGSPELVRAMRHGDWDIVAGQAFEGLSRTLHAVKPFDIPEHWAKFGAIDWGSSKPFSVGWWAVSDGTIGGIPKEALVRFREWYGWTGQADVGLRLSSAEVAAGILERTVEPMDYWVADPAMFAKHDGPSTAERMGDAGLYLIPGDNDRIGGYMEMRDRIAGEDGVPMLFAFSTCVDGFWRTMPDLVIDERKLSGSGKEDVNTAQEDHCYDESRMAVMSRPWARSKREKQLQRDRWASAFRAKENEVQSWKTA